MTGERSLVLALSLVLLTAAVLRVWSLDYGGFSEDEINKINAVRAYTQGNLSANAEHPMMMKAAMLLTVEASRAWNAVAPRLGGPVMSIEAAVRLPNALVGALMVIPMFLLARAFFGPTIAFWASLLLALDVNAAGINRIGKEDTLLVFFLLLGAWLYEEARERHLREGRAPDRWYAASGAAFGLMLAAKYNPQYLGLWALFGIAASAGRKTPQRASKWFYLAIAGAFVAANPAILLPSTWLYILGYAKGGTITHHGAFFAGRVYMNMVEATPGGLPWHFYLTYLVTKTPLPVLAAMAIGLVELVRRRRERGAVFARVILLFFLLPASLVASKFARYLLPTLVVLDLVAALGVARVLELVSRTSRPQLRSLATGLIVAAVVVAPLLAQVESAPYASAYQNVIGRRVGGGPGTLFPNDELYDMGVRETVTWIARHAAPHAAIASDAPGVVAEYLRRAGRADIEARSLSMKGLALPPTQTWLVAQNSHACFESLQVVEQVRRRQAPDYVYRVRGTAAVEAYRMPW